MYLVSHLATPEMGVVLLGDAGGRVGGCVVQRVMLQLTG